MGASVDPEPNSVAEQLVKAIVERRRQRVSSVVRVNE